MKLTKKIFALGVFAAMMAFCLVPGFAFADDVQDPVAKIGNQGYATLGGALDAVQDGETIELQKNVSDCVAFNGIEGKSCKLDLKGYQLKNGSGTIADGNPTIHVESGTLEILNGSIYRGASSYKDRAAVYVKRDASVILTDVDVISNNNYAVQLGDSVGAGTLTINGDTSISVGSADAFPLYVRNGNVTINGGTIGTKGVKGASAIKLDSGSVNIKDGSFSGDLKGSGYTLEGGEYSNLPAFANIAEGYYPFIRTNASDLDYGFQVLAEAAAKEAAAARYQTPSGNYAYYESLEEAKNVVREESTHHLLTIFIDATLAAPENLTYDGNPKAVTPTLPDEASAHYVAQTIVYSGSGTTEDSNAPRDAGTYTATLNGLEVAPNYELSDKDYRYELHKPVALEYTISPASINKFEVKLIDSDDLVYDGTEKKPQVESVGSIKFVESKFDVSYEDNVNAGSGTVVITGKGNYTGKTKKDFGISKRPISDAKVTLDDAELTYNGKPQIQKVSSVQVAAGSIDLEVPLDSLDVTGEATDAGTHTMTLTAKENSNFSGSCTADFTINPLSIKDATVELGDEPVYNGKPQLQTVKFVTVGSGDNAVKVDLDSLEITGKATDAGTHTMTLTAKENTNFKDSCTADFTIKKLNIDSAIVTFGSELTYNGKEQTQDIESIFVGKGDRAVEVDLDSVDVAGNKVTDAGSHMITIAAKDNTNFTGHKKLSFVVNALDLSKAKLTLTKTDFIYNGKVQRPGIKSVVLNNTYLKDGVEFTTTVPDGKNVGTYQVSIAGNGYGYTGTATATFTIKPLAVSKFKVETAKKSFKASWSKFKAERDGVELKYSTKKSIAKAKTVKVKGASAKAKTVKKLKKKTKYYVQARAYKVVDGKTYYSDWSTKKVVKTK